MRREDASEIYIVESGKMALYAISDLHLSLGEDKPMDVFPGWKDYVARLEENWKSTVNTGDTVVIAGDISWAMRLEDTVEDFSFLNSLPGEKILLKGNHDYWWSTRNKMDSFLSSNGFESLHILHNDAYLVGDKSVCGSRGWLCGSSTEEDRKIISREAGRLQTSIDAAKKLGGEPVAFLHYPPVYDGALSEEIMDVLVKENIRRCYFGHIHGRYASRRALLESCRGVGLSLISCDFVGFTPVLIS